MRNLLKYEFQKFIYNKKNFAVIIAFIVFLSGLIIYNHRLDQEYSNTMSTRMWEIADYSKLMVKSMDITSKFMKEEKQVQAYEEQKQFWYKFNTKTLNLVNAYKHDDYRNMTFIENEIAWNELLLEGLNKGYNMNNVTSDRIVNIQEKITQDQYILENKIEIPHSPYETTFFNLFNLIFTGYSTLLLAFFFLLLVFDLNTAEFENGSYKIMYSGKDPVTKIIKAKMVFSFLLVLFYLFLILAVFVIAGIIFGLGDSIFPYPVGMNTYPSYYICLIMLVLYFVALLSLSAIILYVSYKTYSSSVTLVVAITAYMMILVFQQVFDFQWLYSYIPFCYPFVRDIIQAEGVWLCVIFGLVISFLLLNLCCKNMKKRDIFV